MPFMDVAAIEAALRDGLPGCELELQAEGARLELRIVSPVFAGLSRVQRQQKVYALLNERIRSGEIHAVSMLTLTPAEAES